MNPPNKKLIKSKIGFIGGGNMAKAICEGIVRKGTHNNYQNIKNSYKNVVF